MLLDYSTGRKASHPVGSGRGGSQLRGATAGGGEIPARSPGRLRLAVTTFEQPETLWLTICRLLGQGLRCEQMCVLGRASAMALLRREKPGGHCSLGAAATSRLSPATLFDDVAPCSELSDGEVVLATSGPVLELLSEHLSASGATRALLLDNGCQGGAGPLCDGMLTLVVWSCEASQQRIATRALLSSSLNRVRTFELALPGPADTVNCA